MRDVHSNMMGYVIFAIVVLVVIGAILALKNTIDREAREAAATDPELRAWRELRRATRGLAEAARGFREAVGDNVAAQERHREVLGSVGADLEALDARRRRH